MVYEKGRGLSSALIMNSIIMPGSGYFAIGERRKGIVIVAVVLALVIVPMVRYIAAVFSHVHAASQNAIPIVRTMDALGSSWREQRGFIIICIVAVVAIWIFGIIDVALKFRKKTEL